MPLQIKRILILLVLIASGFVKSGAMGLSYVYIQGDKQTPFYVKLEGEMQPRYGKNYCIIPKLAPGPIHIEILFQQNAYPAEKFTILVPESGYRGFMLIKKEGGFSLYDLQQGFYLPNGNSAEDDVAPRTKPVANINIEPTEPSPAATKPVKNEPSKPVTKNTTKTKNTEPKPTVSKPVTSPDNGEPKFISNIELNNERTFGNDTTISDELPASNKNASTLTVANSDCPKPMPRSDYEDLIKKVRNKSDNNRLKYLLEQSDNCYSSVQVRMLTRSLTKDSERYAFLKQIYPRITDQANFPSLESTLTSKEWKGYFQLILE